MAAFKPGPLRGMAFKLGSVAVFTAMAALIKAAGDTPPGQIVFYRSFFALLPILLFFALTGGLRTALKANDPAGHGWRALVGVCAMASGFYALTQLPLPEATALGFASPLFVVAMSALFLGEPVRAFRWLAVAAGLVGVLIILWPRIASSVGPTGDHALLGVAAALAGAFFAAIAMLAVRRLVKTESTPTIVIWFSILATLLSLLTIPFGWAALDTQQAMLLATAGMAGGVAQIMLTESYRHAEASVLAPFEYASILFATLLGTLFFDEAPNSWTISGAAIVIAAGILIIWREGRLGLRRGPIKAVVPPQN
jgi:drug/metabolite transporter (DMT)-like permease